MEDQEGEEVRSEGRGEGVRSVVEVRSKGVE